METRRAFLTTSVAAVGAVAGCASGTERESTDGDPVDDETESTDDGSTENDESAKGEAVDDGPYSVSMEPVGALEFDEPPERWVTYFSGYADMGVALGVEDGLAGIGSEERYHTGYYDELEGVSIDLSDVTQILGEGGIDAEVFYELGSDLHVVDPNWLIENGAFGLGGDEVDGIAEDVAPFFGNVGFRRTDEWHDYRYYSLYETFEKVARVFRREERYEAFEALHDDYIEGIRDRLPPERDRPTVLLVWGGEEPEEFSPYRIGEGTSKKQWRDLGVHDALAETGIDGLSTSDRGRIDYETVHEVDPDVLLVRGHEDKSAAEFAERVLGFMEEHDVASDLRAVREGRVFRGGPLYQGPIVNLFTTERAATQLYPDRFEGDLFDRDRVAELVSSGA